MERVLPLKKTDNLEKRRMRETLKEPHIYFTIFLPNLQQEIHTFKKFGHLNVYAVTGLHKQEYIGAKAQIEAWEDILDLIEGMIE